MGKTYSITAGALAAALALSSCGPKNANVSTVPSRGGYTLSDNMAQMCMDQAEGLAAKLTENPGLASRGIEVNVPSREYGTCLSETLSGQTGLKYVLTPTDNPVYFTLTQVPEK